MYVVTPIWHQKGGDFDGIHNYHFSGGHGTSDWSLRVQVVRPPASRQLAQNKNPRNGAPRIFCDFNGHNYRFSGQFIINQTVPNVNCNLLEFRFHFK